MMYDNFWGICLALPTMLHFTPTGQATSVEAVLPLSMSVQCIHSGTSEIITRWVYTDTVHPLWTKAQAGLHRWPLKNTGLKSMGPPPKKKEKKSMGPPTGKWFSIKIYWKFWEISLLPQSNYMNYTGLLWNNHTDASSLSWHALLSL